MNNKLLVRAMCMIITLPVMSYDNIYLEKLVNDSDALYLVSVAGQDWTFLLTPHSTKRRSVLDNIIDFQIDSPIVLSVLKGDGEPIYLTKGPESTSIENCGKRVAESIIVWTGAESASSQEKTYKSFCVTEDPAALKLTIRADGTPEVETLENITLISTV